MEQTNYGIPPLHETHLTGAVELPGRTMSL